MHLDSADKQAIYRGEESLWSLKKNRAAPHYVPAERGGEKRFVMHSGVALRNFRSEYFRLLLAAMLKSFHLYHVPTCACGRAQKACMKPDFAFKHQIACIQAIYKAP
jgi:hypothetical protein